MNPNPNPNLGSFYQLFMHHLEECPLCTPSCPHYQTKTPYLDQVWLLHDPNPSPRALALTLTLTLTGTPYPGPRPSSLPPNQTLALPLTRPRPGIARAASTR